MALNPWPAGWTKVGRKSHPSTSGVIKRNACVLLTQFPVVASLPTLFHPGPPAPYCSTEHSRHHVILCAHISATTGSEGRLPEIRTSVHWVGITGPARPGNISTVCLSLF